VTSDLASTIWGAARRDIAAFGASIGADAVTVRDDGLLWLSGGPTADFNMGLLDAAAASDSDATLGEFMARVRDAAVEAMFIWPSASNTQLSRRAREEGLTHAGAAPLMSMGTAADRQRQGAGRAVLEAAIAQHRAEAFYLVATESGKPLYDAVGFETIDELAVWVVGQSEQFH
jgi:GNAT superfamily N-acetyltransferase